jgi:hypothetical protein
MRNSKRVIIEKRMKIFTQVTDNRINLRMRFEKKKKKIIWPTTEMLNILKIKFEKTKNISVSELSKKLI